MRRNSKILLKLYRKKNVSLRKNMTVIYPTGILYGSAEVHKPIIDNFPSFRIIVSAVGTPICNLAKFLVSTLSPLTVNEFTVHD